MREKERQVKGNNVKGMGMLNEQSKRPAKANAGEGEGKGMLNEREEKACKGECWQGRREWNAIWERRKGQHRRMAARAEGMECWMKEKERPGAKKNAGDGGGNGMLNEREGKARGKEECWWWRKEWNAEWDRRKSLKKKMLARWGEWNVE
jgi:hypothetical protein